MGKEVIERARLGPFRERLVATKTILFDLKSVYGVSTLRDVTITEGSGAVTNAGGEFKLSTTANGADSATLESAEPGRYQPGTGAEAGIAVRRPTAPAGNQSLLWGYFDGQNGLAFGEDATGVFVLRRSGSTDHKTYQSSWNVDKLDGSGSSGLTLDMSDGTIFQIEWTWYGYGVINWEVVLEDSDGEQDVIVVHRERVEGSVSIENPNLPVSAKVDNGGDATALDLFVGGRQFAVIGDHSPVRRVTSERRQNVTTGSAFEPFITFRRKAEFPSGVNNHVSVKVEGFDIISNVAAIFQIRVNASLTGASFGTPQEHSASETAVEADNSATALSGGEVIYQGLVDGGSNRNSQGLTTQDFRFDFPAEQAVTFCMRKVSGLADADISAVFRVREEW